MVKQAFHEQPDDRPLLIVEDSEDDFMATKRALGKAEINHTIVHCESGQEALDYLLQHSHSHPGLILMDLNMPGLDGRKTLARIREDHSLRQIPVVILTTSTDQSDIKTCYELGANTYIQKPVNFKGLINAMQRMKDYWFDIAILPGDKKHDESS